MIETLIVDDSAMSRNVIRDFLERDGNFRIIGEAADGEEAIQKILSLNPDLVTMDIEMPKMNGLEVIETVMAKSSVPIVVITSDNSAKIAYEATIKGALEFYHKDLFNAKLAPEKRKEIYETLKRISGIKSRKSATPMEPVLVQQPEPSAEAKGIAYTMRGSPLGKRIIHAVVIASSTGGPKALSRFFSLLPGDFPAPVIVVQHNSSGFDESFAQWLNTFTALKVKLAEEGEAPESGVVYIAETGRHLTLRGKAGQNLVMRYNDDEPENNQKPSADVLFRTAAESLGESLVSVVLTGMGSDGAEGTRKIRETGGIVLAQDEESSLIYGMPKAAADTGCVDMILPLDRIPEELVRLTK